MASKYFFGLVIIALSVFDYGQSYNIVTYSNKKFDYKKDGLKDLVADVIKAVHPLFPIILEAVNTLSEGYKKLLEQAASAPKESMNNVCELLQAQTGSTLSTLVTMAGYNDSQCSMETHKKPIDEQLKKIQECLLEPVKNGSKEMENGLENAAKFVEKIDKMDNPEKIVDIFVKMDVNKPSSDEEKALADVVKLFEVAKKIYADFKKCIQDSLPNLPKALLELSKDYLTCVLPGN